MPPRYAYWTILIGDEPTAFRAGALEDIMPTFNRLKEKQPTAVLKWFQNGQLWASRIDAREAMAYRGEKGKRSDPRQSKPGSGYQGWKGKPAIADSTGDASGGNASGGGASGGGKPSGLPGRKAPRGDRAKPDWKPKGEVRPEWKPKGAAKPSTFARPDRPRASASAHRASADRPGDKKSAAFGRIDRPWKPKSEGVAARGPKPEWKPKGAGFDRGAKPEWKPKGAGFDRGAKPEWKPKGAGFDRGAKPEWKPKGAGFDRGAKPEWKPKSGARPDWKPKAEGTRAEKPEWKPKTGEKPEWKPRAAPRAASSVTGRSDVRDKKWRPGGEHQDPRQKYKDAKKAKWTRFKQAIRARTGHKKKP